jgi:hypothetical protein
MIKRLITWLYERYGKDKQGDDHIALIKESLNRTFLVVKVVK